MPLVRVTRHVHFSAAHRLSNPALSAEENEQLYGPCSNQNWHGHNYELEVTVEGEIDPETGYVLDLKRLREISEAAVINDLDHRNLNLDVPWLEGILPSTENLVVAIWNRLAPEIPSGRLVRLVLRETPRNSVEYTGES
jgi:6-pyruvoyltetrahydropterin/6-carboxytetrahydropterin synthase